jgi:hypothetical protein
MGLRTFNLKLPDLERTLSLLTADGLFFIQTTAWGGGSHRRTAFPGSPSAADLGHAADNGSISKEIFEGVHGAQQGAEKGLVFGLNSREMVRGLKPVLSF